MTRNELKTEAKWAIIEKLEEGYDGCLCDLHNEVFNTEMYTNDRDEAAKILDGLGLYIERDKNYARIKVFVQNCGNTELQREWNSLTEKEQKAVADELYYHFRSANK